MNLLTQEAVICDTCRAVMALGRFTSDEWSVFGKQIRVHELAEEERILVHIEELFERYPGLKEMRIGDFEPIPQMRKAAAREWLRVRIPEEDKESLSDADQEACAFLVENYFAQPAEYPRSQRQALLAELSSEYIRCPICKRGNLHIDTAALHEKYRRYLRHWSPGEPILIPVRSWIVPVSIGLIGAGLTIAAFCDKLPVLRSLGIATMLFAASGLWVLGSMNAIAKWYRNAASTENDPTFGREQIFRGQFHVTSKGSIFVWPYGPDKRRSCELFCIDEDQWRWYYDAFRRGGIMKDAGLAVFDLEFRGVFVAVGQSGPNTYLIEILEMLTTNLISLDFGNGAATSLLRAANSEDTPDSAEYLLRVAGSDDGSTPDNELLRPTNLETKIQDAM